MDWASLLIQKYQRKGIIVDTNLMLLLVVGMYDLARIATFKRTCKYNVQIYKIVVAVVEQFQIRYTTPYVVTEVDNLSRNLRDDEWLAISGALRELVAASIELYSDSNALLRSPLHSQIGVADTSIAMIPDALVFTDDLPLYSRLQREGREALNLSHLL
jgi:rRNA-processing protein FCF1